MPEVSLVSALLGRSATLVQPALWWMVPAWLIGWIRPNLARATDVDALALAHRNRLVVGVLLPGVAIVIALVPSIFHALMTAYPVVPEVDYLRIKLEYVYTESLLLMAAAVLLGVFSPSLGALFVLAFGMFDLYASSKHPIEMFPFWSALLGHLIGYALLWLLAVEIPVYGRLLAESAPSGGAQRMRVAVVGGVATGAFVFLWTLAVPTLIRPVFTMAAGHTPTFASIAPLQVAGWMVALTAGIGATLLIWWRGGDGVLGRHRSQPGAWWRARPVRITRHVVVAALLTVGVAGLIVGPRDALMLFLAFLLARPVAWFIVTRTGLDRLTSRLPTIVRVTLAVAVAFGVALLVVPRFYTNDSIDFFSVIVGLIAVLVVIEIIAVDRAEPETPVEPGPVEPGPVVSPVVVGLLGALGLLALSALAPVVVLADNCADASDCYGLGAGAALAAAGGGALLAARKKPPQNDDDLRKKKLEYINRQIEKHPDNPYWQSQHRYWSGDQTPQSDNQPTSAEAFPSSGAATKG